MMIELRIAQVSDLDAILEIMAEGHNESAFVGTYDAWTARHYLKSFMQLEHSTLMLAVDGDEILGGVMMAASECARSHGRLNGMSPNNSSTSRDFARAKLCAVTAVTGTKLDSSADGA